MTTTDQLADYDLTRLVEQHTTLARKTRDEFAGPCPKCGGTDRFLVKPAGGSDGRGIWTCRLCYSAKDLRWSDAIGFVQWLGLAHDFRSACAVLRLDMPASEARIPEPAAPPPCEPPSAAWQARGLALADDATDRLWSDAGTKARAWLMGRGFTEATIHAAGLGYHGADTFDAPEAWGLPREHAKVYTPRGITIPWLIDGELWRLNVRRPITEAQRAAKEISYRGPAGSSNGLYGGGSDLGRRQPVMLVEGEFDALAVRQEASDLVCVVALGSTTGARRVRWLARLAACPLVLVATDNDPDPAKGEAAASHWLHALGDTARRWRPLLKDCNAMLQQGMDVRGWVQSGLEAA